MSNIHPDDISTIEGLIDRFGLSEVLMLIAGICEEKAEHLLSNWQDQISADRWIYDARKIEHAANNTKN